MYLQVQSQKLLSNVVGLTLKSYMIYLLTMSFATSSSMLNAESTKCFSADEENMTGAFDSDKTFFCTASDDCDRSIIIPRRLISAITDCRTLNILE